MIGYLYLVPDELLFFVLFDGIFTESVVGWLECCILLISVVIFIVIIFFWCFLLQMVYWWRWIGVVFGRLNEKGCYLYKGG